MTVPVRLPGLTVFSLAGLLFFWCHTSLADGYGWWFYSFSYEGLNTCLGGGTAEQKRRFIKQTGKLVEGDEALLAIMTPLIDRGLSYSTLEKADAVRVDMMIGWLIRSTDEGVPIIDGRAETSWYLSPYTISQVLPLASAHGRRLLQMFEYGRAYGDNERRSQCLGEGRAWTCWNDSYVMLSPVEVGDYAREIRSLVEQLKKTALWKDPAVRQEMDDLSAALVRAAASSRAMYFWATD